VKNYPYEGGDGDPPGQINKKIDSRREDWIPVCAGMIYPKKFQ
jgi:hypothetical protein